MDNITDKEINEFIQLQNELTAPYCDELVNQFMDGCVYDPLPDTPFRKALPENEIKKSLEKDVREMIIDEAGRRRAMKGMQIIFDEIDKISGGAVYREELIKGGEVLNEKLVKPALELLEKDEKALIQQETEKPQEEGSGTKGNAEFWKEFIPLYKEMGISFETISAIYTIGNQLFSESKFNEAAGVYEILTVLDGSLEEPWFGAGLAHYRLSNWHEAIANFTLAAAVNPGDATIAINLAYCQLELNNREKAKKMIEAAEQIIDLAPSNNNTQRYKKVLGDLKAKAA